MSPGIRYAIRLGTAAAQVVLLLDLLPKLSKLVVYPSRIDFWFFGALLSPTGIPENKKIPAGLQTLRHLEIRGPNTGDSEQYMSTGMNAGPGYAHIKIAPTTKYSNVNPGERRRRRSYLGRSLCKQR